MARIQALVEMELLPGYAVVHDISRCLRILLNTRIGEQDHDREFGIDWSFLDKPISLAKPMCEQELITKIRRYEPRVDVLRVVWIDDPLKGILRPKVVLKIVKNP